MQLPVLRLSSAKQGRCVGVGSVEELGVDSFTYLEVVSSDAATSVRVAYSMRTPR